MSQIALFYVAAGLLLLAIAIVVYPTLQNRSHKR